MLPESIAVPGEPPLHLLRWSREGAPVLLLHGLGGNAYWWEKCAPLLNRQAVSLEFRGHGDSGWARDGVYGLAGFLEDIERARQALGWARFDLVAHSMGARVSLSYARLHPERVRKLVAIDFLPEFGAYMVRKYNLAGRIESPVYPSLDSILPRFRLEPPDTSLDRASLNEFARHCVRPVAGGYGWKFDWNLFHVRYESAWPELPEIQVPTLIVHGEKSTIMNADDASRVASAMPHATIAGIPGAYHHIPVEAPAELAAVIRKFLEA